MRRSEALQGVRMIRFRRVFGRYEADELNQIEAAEMLGISERTFRRWCRRFEEDGEAGLLDRRLGRPSAKRVPVDDEAEVERLYVIDNLVRNFIKGFTESPGRIVGGKNDSNSSALKHGAVSFAY
jgi:hypothetical protein